LKIAPLKQLKEDMVIKEISNIKKKPYIFYWAIGKMSWGHMENWPHTPMENCKLI
jgi:hypothetical protein